MDLTPGEKTVLRQIGVLYATERRRDQQVKALLMQWPPTHRPAYQQAFGGLVSKSLIQNVDAQYFRITEAGLSALGIAPPKAQPVADVPRAPENRTPPQAHVRPALKPEPAGTLSRLAGFLGKR